MSDFKSIFEKYLIIYVKIVFLFYVLLSLGGYISLSGRICKLITNQTKI